MKRTDLVRMIMRAAAAQGISFELLRNSGRHAIWSLNGVRVSIPRHREINERTATGILRTLEAALGEGLVALMGRVKYTATAVRDGGWWAIEVPALPGVFTQARRLDQAEPMVRDVVSLWLHVPGHSFDVEIEPMLGPAADVVRDAIVARKASEQAERKASASMVTAATTLVDSGLTLRDAGTILHVSYQRIQQIVGGVRSAG